MEIADRLDTNVTSIIQYLKIGMAIGLCKTYSKEMSNKRQAKNRSAEFYTYIKAIDARTNELVGVFYDIDNFIYNYYKLCGVRMRKKCIRDIINRNTKRYTHNGLSFSRIDENEYSNLVSNCKINDIIDDKNKIIVMSDNCLYDDDLLY